MDINDKFFLLTLGVNLRLEMTSYYLVLRQKLRNNYDTNIIGFGLKSLATNNVFSNNLKKLINFVEGNLIYVIYLINLKKVFII
jgi:hypothetical protein